MLGERELTDFERKLVAKLNKETNGPKKILPSSPLEKYLDNYEINVKNGNDNEHQNDNGNFLRSKKNFQFVMSSLKKNKELITECKSISSGSVFIMKGNKNLIKNSEITTKENNISESEFYEKIGEEKAKIFFETSPNEKKEGLEKIRNHFQKNGLLSETFKNSKQIDFPKKSSFQFPNFDENTDVSIFFKHLKTKDTIIKNTLKLNLGKNYGNLFLEEPQPNILKNIERKKFGLNSFQKMHIERIKSATNMERPTTSKKERKSEKNEFQSRIKELTFEMKFPKWFIEREDVIKKIRSPEFDIKLKMIKIYEKPFFKRTQEERNILFDFLKKFKIFSFFDEAALERMTLKISAEFYEEKKTILNQKECKNSLIILYSGSIDFVKNARVMMSFKETTVLPRYIFREDHKIYSNLVTTSPTYILKFNKYDYEDIVKNFLLSHQKIYEEFLKTVPVVSEMDEAKLKELIRSLNPLLLIKNEIVFKKTDETDSIFILKFGSIQKKVPIYLEKIYKCPIGNKQWNIEKVIQTIEHSIFYSPGCFIGIEEILEDKQRKTSLEVAENSLLLELSESKFFEIFDGKYLTLFRELFLKDSNNFDDVVQKNMKEKYEEENKKVKCLKNAINSNLNDYLPTDTTKYLNFLKKEKRIHHWFDRVKQKSKENLMARKVIDTAKMQKTTFSYYD